MDSINIGDRIKVVEIPEGLDDETKSLFELCVGRILPVVGIVPAPEIASERLELEVGEVLGQPAYMHSIWIERRFVIGAVSGRDGGL
jgi:hypothetical protein